MGKKVLIIDDDEGDRVLIQSAIERAGIKYSITTAQSGEEGIQKVNECHPDFVIIDTRMPGINGFETCRRLRAQEDANYKIIVCTGDPAAVNPIEATEAGAHQYCIKTAESGEVINALRQLELEDVYVLVAEDEMTSQELIRAYFDLWGYRADYVDNGEKAVEMVKINVYDFCLMDLRMPVLGGIEATKIIKEFKNSLPIIALTASILPEAREKALGVGMDDFLTKPIDIIKFRETILKFIEQSKKKNG